VATPYLTPATLRSAVSTLADVGRYPDQVLADLVAEFEQIAEVYRGVAFTPRTAVETYTICSGATSITLLWPRVRSVASVVIDGTTASSSTYRATEYGVLQSSVGFIASSLFPHGQAVITYDHGYDAPTSAVMPGSALLRACREYVRICAVADRSNVPRDIISTSADGMSTRYSTPDIGAGRPTGYIEVDRLLNSLPDYRTPAIA
jgi:hypothetical protein